MQDRQFQVYAQTRSTRQLAGDLKCEMQAAKDQAAKDQAAEDWKSVEYALNDVECQLEQILARRAKK
jgi:hypothetical protein